MLSWLPCGTLAPAIPKCRRMDLWAATLLQKRGREEQKRGKMLLWRATVE